MALRKFIESLEAEGRLVRISKEVSTDFEIANVLAALDGRVVLFEKVRNSKFPVVGNLVSSRELVASSLGLGKERLLEALVSAINSPKEPAVVGEGSCQEVVEGADLDALPILRYMPKDGGRYIASAVCITRDPETGARNSSFHRLMQMDRNHFAARIVENRGTYTALRKRGELDVAICVGNSIPVLLAGATSFPIGVDELGMANALEETRVVKCKTVDLEVPAETEFVLEGRITGNTAKEGPFLDLTETYDRVREQPVIEIKKMTRRKDAIFHALLPGMGEHKLLMGMPREPTIFNEVSKVCRCRNVLVTPGGASWLHAIVQIEKQNDDDGRRAAEAAFRGHSSLKHCVVVEDDIDIYNPNDVEWAIATRFQADRDATVVPDQPGSSLDPSGDLTEGKKATTCKAGLDATIPWDKKDKGFRRERYGAVDLKDYL
jgi:UbiD family decarboxylase